MNQKTRNLRIDALRGFAVLAVVAFHSSLDIARGGFLGVDIFFVISGFLIYQSIETAIRDNRFSLRKFWRARFYRLVPAILPVVTISFFIAWRIFPTNTMKDLSQSILATLTGLSNVFFWTEVGYFDSQAIEKPLLHTWSLSAEVQFYIFLPLLLLALNKLSSARMQTAVFASLAGISFASASLLQPLDGDAAYFLLPFRIWEFLLGVLMARSSRQFQKRFQKKSGTYFAVAVLLGSIVYFDEKIGHPGILTLGPVLATCVLLMGSNGPERPGSALALPMSFLSTIGRWSYGIFLWHFPIIVFANALGLFQLGDPIDFLAVLGISTLFGGLSYRFLESRVLANFSQRSERTVFTATLLSLTVTLGALGFLGHTSGGYYQRFPATLASTKIGWIQECEGVVLCLRGNQSSTRAILLVGDSHAMQLGVGLEALFGRNFRIDILASGACFFLGPEDNAAVSSDPELCKSQRNYAQKSELPYEILLFSQRWHGYSPETLETVKENDFFIANLERSAARTLLVGSSPDVETLCRQRAYLAGEDMQCLENLSDSLSLLESSIPRPVKNSLEQVSLADKLCPSNLCTLDSAGESLFFDDHHFSDAGSIWAVAQIQKQILSQGTTMAPKQDSEDD